MSDVYTVKISYEDGTERTLSTGDGKRAMNEASNGCWQEEVGKTVTLTKNNKEIFSETVKPYAKSSHGEVVAG